MRRNSNSSYKFSFGDVNFQVDIDESLSSELRNKDFPITKDKVLHSHPYYELFFIFNDDTEIVFEKETKRFTNHIVCLPPNMRHYTLRSLDYRILFSYNSKNDAKGGFKNFISKFLAAEELCLIPIDTSGLEEYLKELCELFYNQQNDLDSEVIVSLLKCIFHRIYSLYIKTTSAKKQGYSANESRYITVNSLISKCTSRESNITISTIAEALCLSKKQTSRLIDKYYGKTLSEVITDEKLNYAVYLLKNTNHSIYDIAFECNFHSYSYFCFQFKKKFGCVPLQYRKEK